MHDQNFQDSIHEISKDRIDFIYIIAVNIVICAHSSVLAIATRFGFNKSQAVVVTLLTLSLAKLEPLCHLFSRPHAHYILCVLVPYLENTNIVSSFHNLTFLFFLHTSISILSKDVGSQNKMICDLYSSGSSRILPLRNNYRYLVVSV